METRESLLERAQDGDDQKAWDQLVDLYRPLIERWLQRQGCQAADAADLSQEVLLALYRELPGFKHNGRRGSFRNWLRRITVYRCRRYWQTRAKECRAAQTDSAMRMLAELEDPSSQLARRWDEEHDAHVLRTLVDTVEVEFGEAERRAFQRTAMDGVPAKRVAEELGVPVAKVYKSRFHFLRRLREVAAGLLEDD